MADIQAICANDRDMAKTLEKGSGSNISESLTTSAVIHVDGDTLNSFINKKETSSTLDLEAPEKTEDACVIIDSEDGGNKVRIAETSTETENAHPGENTPRIFYSENENPFYNGYQTQTEDCFTDHGLEKITDDTTDVNVLTDSANIHCDAQSSQRISDEICCGSLGTLEEARDSNGEKLTELADCHPEEGIGHPVTNAKDIKLSIKSDQNFKPENTDQMFAEHINPIPNGERRNSFSSRREEETVIGDLETFIEMEAKNAFSNGERKISFSNKKDEEALIEDLKTFEGKGDIQPTTTFSNCETRSSFSNKVEENYQETFKGQGDGEPTTPFSDRDKRNSFSNRNGELLNGDLETFTGNEDTEPTTILSNRKKRNSFSNTKEGDLNGDLNTFSIMQNKEPANPNGEIQHSPSNTNKLTIVGMSSENGHVDPVSVSSSPEQDAKAGSVKVFKRRWYILLVFCLYSFAQAAVWNTFGPISSTSEEALGWTDGDIALLSNWGPIAYITTSLIFSWMLDVKGLRWACISSAILVFIGTCLRCFTMEAPAVTWLVHTGHLLNGIGGPVAMGAAPRVSAVWFPLHERATATAIGTACNFLGVAVAFLLGPWLVHSHQHLVGNSSMETMQSNSTISMMLVNGSNNYSQQHFDNSTRLIYAIDVEKEREEILLYMYIEAGACGALLLLMLVYFPSLPPLPPCASAAIQREHFFTGLKHLLKRRQFWVVSVIYGASVGVLGVWASLITLDLSSQGVGETEAGWIGFYATVSGCVLTLIVARFADLFTRIMKKFIIGLYSVSLVFFLIFALTCNHVIPEKFARPVFYVTIIGGMTSLNSAVPLIFELACEMSYPTGEGTTNLVLTTVNNIGGLIFLSVGMIPNIGSIWMNWTIVGVIGVCLPMWLFLREAFNRLAIDEAHPTLERINIQVVVTPDDVRHDVKGQSILSSGGTGDG